MKADERTDRPREETARPATESFQDRASAEAHDNANSDTDEPTTFIGDNGSYENGVVTFSLNGAPPEAWGWIGRPPEVVLEGYLAVDRPDEDGEYEAWCPIHENPATSDPSARINFQRSVWHCFAGCPDGELGELVWRLGQHGPVVIEGNGATGGWEASPSDLGRTRQRRRQPLPSVGAVVGWHEGLLSNSDRLTYLDEDRGLSQDTIKRFRLGWDKDDNAYTIPVYDEHGDLANLKYYRPGGEPKMWGVTGHNEARLYPLPEFVADDRDEVVFCEGELDALIARQEGFNAVTVTGGARTAWRDEWSPFFKDKRVFLVTDSDNPGRRLAQDVRQALKGVARQVVFVPLPYEVKEGHGEDLTDYLVRDWHTADALRALMAEAAENAPEDPDPDELDEHHPEVQKRLWDQRVRDKARELFRLQRAREEGSAPPDLDEIPSAEEWLAMEDEDPVERIEAMMHEGHNGTLGGRDKSGKTTLAIDLTVSLTNREDEWLGQFALAPPPGTVGWINCEMDEAQLRKWMRDAGVNPENLAVLNLRDNVPNLLDPWWWSFIEAWLIRENVTFLIVDSLTEIVEAAGLDEDKEGVRVLLALNRLRPSTALSEMLVLGHFGHGGERLRGTSKFGGWVDSKLSIVTQEEDGVRQRFLSATGRLPHDLREGQVMRAGDGRLRFQPHLSRAAQRDAQKKTEAIQREMENEELRELILTAVEREPGINATGVREFVQEKWKDERGQGVGNKRVDAARDDLAEEGLIRVEGGGRGSGRAKHHYPAEEGEE